jgi:hypothetical protein
MCWYYNNEIVESLPEDCVGFVYLITNLTNQKKYIGKKLAKFTKTKYKVVKLKNGTKKRKKLRESVDSDWKDYWSSSIELKKHVEELGIGNFKREILKFCKSKAECSYVEAKLQFQYGVLESDDYYNGQISVRCHQSHIKGKI